MGPCPSGPAVTANTWHSSIHRCRPPARCCTSPGDAPSLRKGIQLGWGAPGSVLSLDIGGGTSVGRRGLCGKRCVSHVSLGPACLVVQALAGQWRASFRVEQGIQELQNKLRQEFFLLSEEWGSSGGYESWFANSLNNAQLSTVTSYNDLVPNFEKLLKQSGDDLEVFYSSVAELAKLNEIQRKAKLQ